ncbi:MAG TPA: hypothetical protein V6C50_01235, partial [Crinalium sp.]
MTSAPGWVSAQSLELAKQRARYQAAPLAFKGRYLVSISDADMLASAYVDGRLGAREGQDTINVVPLTGHARDFRAYAATASNSVAGPPTAVVVTPDGRYALVVETFRPRPAGDEQTQTFADLRQGNHITVVDLSDPTRPRPVQALAIAERPTSVSINHDGSLVAVTFHPGGAGTETPLALIPFERGRLGQPTYPIVPRMPPGDELVHAEWHPTAQVLALVNNTGAEVSLVQVGRQGTSFELQPNGNVVRVEKFPFMARFTADGRHVLVNNLFWGADVEGTWSEAPRGSVVSIRLAAGTQADGSPRHAL